LVAVVRESKAPLLPKIKFGENVTPGNNPVFVFGSKLQSLALVYWLSPYWYLLTAFVGLNLLQSGFTNRCPAMWMLGKCRLTSSEQATHAQVAR
jgi:hypothetical protein